jgi:pimeloyl-ACP methyl ester carboxylesterase
VKTFIDRSYIRQTEIQKISGKSRMSVQLQIEGIDVFVEGQGDETIVMIHGWPDTYRLWDEQAACFKTKYRCVRFTLPGFDIDKPRQAYSLAETIRIFKSVIEQVSPDRKVILMLHDWGCVFGYQFAMQNPAMVSAIIGVDVGETSSLKSELSFKAKGMMFSYQVFLALAWRIGGGIGDRMTRWLARAFNCTSEQRYIGSCMNYPYYIRWFKAHGSYDAAVPVAPACPLLFIYGTKKPFMFHSKKWAQQLALQSGSQVLEFRTSHWVMRDQPNQFNQAVDTWLSSTAR